MMAAAVCLGEEFSPTRLFSLGSLLVPSCLSQGRWRSDNPGSKYFQFLPSPSSSSHISMLQNLSCAVLLPKLPRARLRYHPNANPSLAACPATVLCWCTAVTSPSSLTRQWLYSSAKQGVPRRQQVNDVCPQIHSACGIGPSSQEADDLPMRLVAQWGLQVSSRPANMSTALNFPSVISHR